MIHSPPTHKSTLTSNHQHTSGIHWFSFLTKLPLYNGETTIISEHPKISYRTILSKGCSFAQWRYTNERWNYIFFALIPMAVGSYHSKWWTLTDLQLARYTSLPPAPSLPLKPQNDSAPSLPPKPQNDFLSFPMTESVVLMDKVNSQRKKWCFTLHFQVCS